MRAFALGLIFSAASLPCFAQTVLKSEPLILAPYEIAFVQDANCPVGKVLKVTGAIRGLNRRKACVVLASEQASLAAATPLRRRSFDFWPGRSARVHPSCFCLSLWPPAISGSPDL